MPGPTQEQNAYVARVFGVDPSTYQASPSGGAPGAPNPASPPPPPELPPDGILPRAGDGALYWHPNAGSSVAKASRTWIRELLEYYWLAPADPDPAFTFNRAPSDLPALETLRNDKQLDTVARRAKQPRLRLGVLAVMHDLGSEWSSLMKSASDPDQEAARKHVYGTMMAGDASEGHAPKVDADPTSKSERPLNSAEIAYVDRIFHGSIDYGKVKIGKGGITTAFKAARTIGNTIHPPDFAFIKGSMELEPDVSDVLVHEMTHVWQYQHRGWTYAPAALWAQLTHPGGGAYEWRPAPEKRRSFASLNPEAQAEAVQDYNAALRRVISGNAVSDDYETLKLVKNWQAAFVAGPRR